jgi:hypothetical protein
MDVNRRRMIFSCLYWASFYLGKWSERWGLDSICRQHRNDHLAAWLDIHEPLH